MLVSVFLALFLPCAGMSAVFLVYICLLWYAASTNGGAANGGELQSSSFPPGKGTQGKGLSPSDLDKLPKVTGKELGMGSAECCAVCLDEIAGDEPARLIPGCNHGFHLQCADTWLSKHSVCPVCRAKLSPELFDPPESNPC
ncbi:OLC1v1018342C1 [Oldenlandia corymbosa var. corymbosa]|uniref:OLC1v1018342C1 n=1 Tax=Oldenlandia corymbosa var. corymbosa TaxID=529605 RepID=A0AAV1EBR5_OLDCO|nr:OLC1v1018342C1 [Oldenlandia corymbosa var. corymbosa]